MSELGFNSSMRLCRAASVSLAPKPSALVANGEAVDATSVWSVRGENRCGSQEVGARLFVNGSSIKGAKDD